MKKLTTAFGAPVVAKMRDAASKPLTKKTLREVLDEMTKDG